MTETRLEELRRELHSVHRRIGHAARSASRSPDDVTLIVVTKTFPTSDVRLLASLGVHDIGESRHQEAVVKKQECADLALRWHFVGRLQSNKAAAVARYASVVHSVDRLTLVGKLADGAARAGRRVDCLIQVNLHGGDGRGLGGAGAGDLDRLADSIASAGGLALRGLMAVAPLGVDPTGAFERLSELSQRLRRLHGEATWISAGMSGDLEAAVVHGATHVRVGSAVLGARPLLR
ncbi:MAG: YggS family pyridoxal phosphate-dependent enzyme [Nocardioidaceae bacterium]